MSCRTEQNLWDRRVLGDLKEEFLLYGTNNKRQAEEARGVQGEECVCVRSHLRGVGDSECDHVFAGVFNEEVMLIQQLHLPHPQPSQLIKKLEKPGGDETKHTRVSTNATCDDWKDASHLITLLLKQ